MVIIRRTERTVVEEIEFSDDFDTPDPFSTKPRPKRPKILAAASRLLSAAREPLLLPDLRPSKP